VLHAPRYTPKEFIEPIDPSIAKKQRPWRRRNEEASSKKAKEAKSRGVKEVKEVNGDGDDDHQKVITNKNRTSYVPPPSPPPPPPPPQSSSRYPNVLFDVLRYGATCTIGGRFGLESYHVTPLMMMTPQVKPFIGITSTDQGNEIYNNNSSINDDDDDDDDGDDGDGREEDGEGFMMDGINNNLDHHMNHLSIVTALTSATTAGVRSHQMYEVSGSGSNGSNGSMLLQKQKRPMLLPHPSSSNYSRSNSMTQQQIKHNAVTFVSRGKRHCTVPFRRDEIRTEKLINEARWEEARNNKKLGIIPSPVSSSPSVPELVNMPGSGSSPSSSLQTVQPKEEVSKVHSTGEGRLRQVLQSKVHTLLIFFDFLSFFDFFFQFFFFFFF
jgi:hypothetical protein